MSRLTRDEPYDGIGLIRRLWDLDFTIAFTQGKWRGEVLNGREPGIHGRIESADESKMDCQTDISIHQYCDDEEE